MSLLSNLGASKASEQIMNFINKQIKVAKEIDNEATKENVLEFLRSVYKEANSIKDAADNGWY